MTDPVVRDYREWHLQKGEDYDQNLSRGDFNTYMAEHERAIVTRLVKKLFPAGVPRYLDFACGTGRITSVVESLARESYGVDISETMLAEARQKCAKTTFVRADLVKERVELPRVDLVTAFRFFGNAQDELRRDALAAIHGLLVPGGYFLLNNHLNSRSLHHRLLRASKRPMGRGLDYRLLHRLLDGAGFEVLETYGIGLWILRYKWTRPNVTSSGLARVLEPLSRLPFAARLCPDMVILARRKA